MAIDAVAHTAFMFSPAVLVALTLTSAIAIFIRRRNQTNKSASVKTKEILAQFRAHPGVHIANTEEVERKLSALISGGAAKLAVTADWYVMTFWKSFTLSPSFFFPDQHKRNSMGVHHL